MSGRVYFGFAEEAAKKAEAGKNVGWFRQHALPVAGGIAAGVGGYYALDRAFRAAKRKLEKPFQVENMTEDERKRYLRDAWLVAKNKSGLKGEVNIKFDPALTSSENTSIPGRRHNIKLTTANPATLGHEIGHGIREDRGSLFRELGREKYPPVLGAAGSAILAALGVKNPVFLAAPLIAGSTPVAVNEIGSTLRGLGTTSSMFKLQNTSNTQKAVGLAGSLAATGTYLAPAFATALGLVTHQMLRPRNRNNGQSGV